MMRIPAIDTTTTSTPTQIRGVITRAHPRQLNQQVFSFLQTIRNLYKNMMLPKSDVFVTLRNDGPSIDERGKFGA